MRISKTVDVAVDVDFDVDLDDHLSDISTDVLAEELRRRVKVGEHLPKDAMDDLFEDSDALEAAAWRFKRGDYEDALFHLESVLGNDFIGLAEILRKRAA